VLTNTVVYSTFLGQGSGPEVRADANGNAYVAAITTQSAWPVTAGVYQSQCAAVQCNIALKVNPAGSTLIVHRQDISRRSTRLARI
jgi:hypothetical protein